MSYRKVWWTNATDRTAGLVFEDSKIQELAKRGNFNAELSRHWPMSEALKMRQLCISPSFATWEEAFNFTFPEVKS